MHINFRHVTPTGLIRYLDAHRFDRCWLMTWEEKARGAWHYEDLCIEDVHEAFCRFPSRIVPMYAPDPASEDAAERLREWHGKGVRGCAELKTSLSWKSRRVRRLLDAVSDLDIPLVFHMEGPSGTLRGLETDSSFDAMLLKAADRTRPFRLPKKVFNALARRFGPLGAWRSRHLTFPGYLLDLGSLEDTLREYPRVRFIGHGPYFWGNLTARAKGQTQESGALPCTEGPVCSLLKRYPNLYADTSAPSGFQGLCRDRALAQRLLSELSHKILYGTDNYFMGQEALLKSLGLSKEAMSRIMGENAEGLMSL